MPVCARCGQENPDAARFCLACGSPLTAAATPARRERKVVTVLFADLVGFTGRAERLDPEDVRAMLEPYHARLKHELERHGGTVEKFIGDAVVALFGAPVAHEDDPERAVRAALASRAALAELNSERPERALHVRIGITTGEALVSLGARPAEGEGMAAGDVVNTAARLQAAAPVDGILVDEPTRRAAADAIELRPHDAVEAKGKSEPVPVWEAVAARASFGVDVEQDARTPLVGRTRELAVLTEALARARAEHVAQLVTLIGVPGIGKSRLVWELFRLVDADPELISWRQGRCLSYGEGVAFSALGEMVKAQAGVLETHTAAEAEEQLRETVAALLPDEVEREWVLGHVRPLAGLQGATGSGLTEAFAAWRRLLEALAEQRPLVLVFEDLHWADGGLLDFVDHLVDWASGVPLLVVCTARPELLERRPAWGGGKLNAATLALSPLAEDDAARLFASLLERPLLPAPLQQVLLERAGGNPLYAEQYVRMLADRGMLVSGGGWNELPLPETLQGIIAARLDLLPGEEKLLLQDAAVIGKVFWPGALAAADAAGLLHRLERKGFVRRERRSSVADETEYAFVHALVRDVAYGQIPRLERAAKHRRAAEWVEALAAERSEAQAQIAAHHWVQALELTGAAGGETVELADRARRALVEAGDRLQRLGANDAAREPYARALALTPADDPQRPDLLRRYGQASAYTGIDADAELAEAAAGLLALGEIEAAAEAVDVRGWYLWNVGRGDESRERNEEALALVADRAPSPTQARVFGQYSIHCMLAGRDGDAVVYAERELELGRVLGLGRHRAHALITLGSVRGLGGDRDALDVLREGVELARELNDVPTLVRGYKNLGSALAVFADLAAASEVTEEALRTARRYGDTFNVGWFEVELTFGDWQRGRWQEARRRLLGFLEGLGAKRHYMEAPARSTLGRIEAELGRLEDGIRESAAALEVARSVREAQLLLPALASHACVLARAGRNAEAAALLDEFARDLDGPTVALPDAALAAVALGRGGSIADIDAVLLANPWGQAASAYARGDFAEAAERYAAVGALVYEAESRLALGQALAAAGAADEAARELAAAESFFRGAGASRPTAARAPHRASA